MDLPLQSVICQIEEADVFNLESHPRRTSQWERLLKTFCLEKSVKQSGAKKPHVLRKLMARLQRWAWQLQNWPSNITSTSEKEYL